MTSAKYSSATHRIRFGIPTLDELLGCPKEHPGTNPATDEAPGIDFSVPDKEGLESTSMCLIGPHGTGKSVLGLHLASNYAARWADGVRPKVMYISTDLKYEKAHRVWHNFMLGYPKRRPIPFTQQRWYDLCHPADPTLARSELADLPIGMHVKLVSHIPGQHFNANSRPITNFICNRQTSAVHVEVAFLNLATDTAGDDWGFLNRMLALLEAPSGVEPPHMIIIDAVEGLETLVGDRDAFGEQRSRRSRIAQIMRTAGPKCHVVLIVEDSNEDVRLPEDFVTDAVIRLRAVEVVTRGRHYLRRTVEIEKVRAQTHIRGQHPFTIRDGSGSSTGGKYNPDDPPVAVVIKKVRAINPNNGKSIIAEEPVSIVKPRALSDLIESEKDLDDSHKTLMRYVSYFQVFHSLHYINRNIMLGPPRQTAGTDKSQCAGFGIHYLDNMLQARIEPSTMAADKQDAALKATDGDVTNPLPSLTDHVPGTAHSGWHASISETADASDSDDMGLPHHSVTALIGENGTYRNRLAYAFLRGCFTNDRSNHAAVLISTQDIDADRLSDRIKRVTPAANADDVQRVITDRIVCRRLEVHDLSSAVLFHIIRCAVDEARYRVRAFKENNTSDRHEMGRRIRLVISNLEVMRATYPDVVDDPLFLPALTFWLIREGLTALLVHSETGGPDRNQHSSFTHVLSNEVHYTLYSWHVSFYGEDKVAIACIPPIVANQNAAVRELKSKRRAVDGRIVQLLEVDPHFEIYTGLLEREKPCLVPLTVRLWGGTEMFKPYFDQVNAMFLEVFANKGSNGDLVSACRKEQYDDLRSASHLKGSTRLENTLVLQVDEFWFAQHGELQNMRDYLFAKTVNEEGKPEAANDPYRLFQLSKNKLMTRSLRRGRADAARRDPSGSYPDKSFQRVEFFKLVGHDYKTAIENDHVIDRIPYLWDFGFLLVRKSAWQSAFDKNFTFSYSDQSGSLAEIERTTIQIRDVWHCLSRIDGEHGAVRPATDDNDSQSPKVAPVSWRVFLHACTVVARTEATKVMGNPIAFDVDMMAPETIACLVLEIWASVIYEMSGSDPSTFAKERADRGKLGLVGLLKRHTPAFFRTWLLLGEVLSASQFGEEWLKFEPRPAQDGAVASRHWYSTATCAQANRAAADPLVPVKLPGRYSVRGDWFLAIASGSRSPRLGERAIDLLSTRRANIQRLQEGLGLPTRHITDERTMAGVWTKLYTVGEFGVKIPVDYKALVGLGADTATCWSTEPDPLNDFYWLWRYTLKDYDRHATVFPKMLSVLLNDWQKYWRMAETEGSFRSGFEAYDKWNSVDSLKRQPSYMEFKKACHYWIDRLQDAAPEEVME